MECEQVRGLGGSQAPGGTLKWSMAGTHLIIQALVVEGNVEGEGG